MKIGAVINHKSGTLSPQKKKKRLDEIRQQLEQFIHPEYLMIESGENIEKKIKFLLQKEIDVLVIGGGDGTVSTAAQHLAHTQIPLLVLALGTMNNFARDAGIPPDHSEAIRLLGDLKIKQVDLGEVNGEIFINNATIGIYPNIVREREEKTKKRGWLKWPAQISAIIVSLIRMPRLWVKVETEKLSARRFTPFLFVGNNRYGGISGSDFSRTSLSSGNLWLCMARVSGFRSLFRMAWQIIVRNIHETENLETSLETNIIVKPWKYSVRIAIDGENHRLKTPLHFRILKKRLHLVVP